MSLASLHPQHTPPWTEWLMAGDASLLNDLQTDPISIQTWVDRCLADKKIESFIPLWFDMLTQRHFLQAHAWKKEYASHYTPKATQKKAGSFFQRHGTWVAKFTETLMAQHEGAKYLGLLNRVFSSPEYAQWPWSSDHSKIFNNLFQTSPSPELSILTSDETLCLRDWFAEFQRRKLLHEWLLVCNTHYPSELQHSTLPSLDYEESSQ